MFKNYLKIKMVLRGGKRTSVVKKKTIVLPDDEEDSVWRPAKSCGKWQRTTRVRLVPPYYKICTNMQHTSTSTRAEYTFICQLRTREGEWKWKCIHNFVHLLVGVLDGLFCVVALCYLLRSSETDPCLLIKSTLCWYGCNFLRTKGNAQDEQTRIWKCNRALQQKPETGAMDRGWIQQRIREKMNTVC